MDYAAPIGQTTPHGASDTCRYTVQGQFSCTMPGAMLTPSTAAMTPRDDHRTASLYREVESFQGNKRPMKR